MAYFIKPAKVWCLKMPDLKPDIWAPSKVGGWLSTDPGYLPVGFYFMGPMTLGPWGQLDSYSMDTQLTSAPRSGGQWD